jgi:CAAX prenyl protease-like protein
MTLRAVAPLVLPFLLFSIFLAAEGLFPAWHYLIYPFKSLATAAIILLFWRELPTLRPSRPLLSALLGLVGVVLWVGLDPVLVHRTRPATGLNPFLLYPGGLAWTLFALRLAGMALVVPVMEELFWRGFLMRWLIKEDFTSVPLGTYTPVSFFVTTACFASVHGAQWPLAAIVGLLYGAWFIFTRRLGDIILTHGVTNLLLGLYALVSGDWHFLALAPPSGH